MTENYLCTKEGVLGDLRNDVSVLKKDAATDEKRLDKVESKIDDMSTISTAISVMSLSLEHIVEHNHRQDDLMRSQSKTLGNINENLNRLNEGQTNLEKKVENLETRVDHNDELHTIDLRNINKIKEETYLKQYAGPVAAGVAIGGVLIQLLNVFF